MPVSFDQKCLQLTFLTILKRWNLLTQTWETAKYSYSCMLKYYRETTLLQVCFKFNWLCFLFRPITLKLLNSLTSTDTFSWLGGVETSDCGARHPGLNSRLWQVLLCLIFFICFYFFWLNNYFVMIFCISFCNVNLFSILNILLNLWAITGVSRYRPSIFIYCT